ncbi:recombinase family protein, partial [Mediterraneibacter gnavus]
FKEKGVILRILNMPTTLIELDGQQWVIEMINNIILEVLSSVAEQERITTLERQREGIESAKKRGVKFGRPD